MAGDDDNVTTRTSISDDITHRLHGLMVSTSEATEGALSSHPPPANNAVVDIAGASTQTTTRPSPTSRSSSKEPVRSKAIMARKLESIRRRRLFDRRRPSVGSITDELEKLTVTRGGFRPTAEELVGLFLRPKIAGRALPRAARFIHDADVYAATPDHLAATHAAAPGGGSSWYFFSSLHLQSAPDGRTMMPCRRVGGGHGVWKLTGSRGKLEVDGDGGADWYGRCLYYYELRRHGDPVNGSRRRTEWYMREYSMTHQDSGRQHPLVLCEVYNKETSQQWRQRRNHE